MNRFFLYSFNKCPCETFLQMLLCQRWQSFQSEHLNDGCICSCKRCSHHKLILAKTGLMESGMKGDLENLVGNATQDGMVDGVMVTRDQDYMNGVI